MQSSTRPIPMPEGEQGIDNDDTEQRGFSDTDANARTEPATGETSERDPAWRPGDAPPGEGVYEKPQDTSTGVEDEPEGPGI
jgi:hypothetical protein